MVDKDLMQTFFFVVDSLEQASIPYMLVGSVASMVYGEPRLTHDLDVVIDLSPANAQKFCGLFTQDEFYCSPLAVIQSEVIARGQFNLLHQATGYKINMMVRKNTPHIREEFARKVKVPFWNESFAYVASAEDVMLKKLDFYRQAGSEKHLLDIRSIQAHTALDQAYLDHWVAELGLQKLWAQV